MRQRRQLYRREIADMLALERATAAAARRDLAALPWRMRWGRNSTLRRIIDMSDHGAALLERVLHGREPAAKPCNIRGGLDAAD